MKKKLLILLSFLTVSCGNKHLTVDDLYNKEMNIRTIIEQEINQSYWNIEVDLLEFNLKEQKNDGYLFDCVVFGTLYDNFNFETVSYYDMDFVSTIEIRETPIGKYSFNSFDVIDNCKEIKRH